MNQGFYEISKISLFYSPKKIILGQDTVKRVGDEAKALGRSRALMVTDPGIVSAGYSKIVEDALHTAKIEVGIFDRVVPEPPARCVEDGVNMIREGKYDIVIGIGGGSSLDIAKGVAIMAKNPGRVVDYAGIDLVPNPGLPKILIPTTAGTGSETSRSLVVIDERDNTKKSIASSFGISDVAILDPMLTLSMPPQVTANTGMDALVHAIESYVSATTTPFAEILAIEAIGLIAHNLPLAYSKGSNLMARYNMLLAASLAGLAFASSRLGIVHGLAYVIDTEYHLPHGRANAIMLPHVMDFNKTGNLAKFGRIAEAMGEPVGGLSPYESADKSVQAVKNLLAALQVPYQLSQYGIPKGHMPKLVEGGMKQARLFVPNPRDVTEDDLRNIYEKAF
jgi:alcohol dehydrogenase class IV